MAWVTGIDEAGYGPNLGPLVMSAVSCQLPEEVAEADLWELLGRAARRERGKDQRLHINDSKTVYSTGRGLLGLEQGVLAALWPGELLPKAAAELVTWLAPEDAADLSAELWYCGKQKVPVVMDVTTWPTWQALFSTACKEAGVCEWKVRSVVLCTPRFNAILDRHESKGAVLADALGRLLSHLHATLAGEGPLWICVDKHGGRNSYAPLIQNALGQGMVWIQQESMERSSYRVSGLSREMKLTFQPRADGEHFCVALASMVSKYLREVLMLELNAFWQEHVPGLKPTAGYPTDATRFLTAIRATARKLGIEETTFWRRK